MIVELVVVRSVVSKGVVVVFLTAVVGLLVAVDVVVGVVVDVLFDMAIYLKKKNKINLK